MPLLISTEALLSLVNHVALVQGSRVEYRKLRGTVELSRMNCLKSANAFQPWRNQLPGLRLISGGDLQILVRPFPLDKHLDH